MYTFGAVSIIKYLTCLEYLLVYSMTTVTFHHREAMSLSMLLNDVTNLPVFHTRFHWKKALN